MYEQIKQELSEALSEANRIVASKDLRWVSWNKEYTTCTATIVTDGIANIALQLMANDGNGAGSYNTIEAMAKDIIEDELYVSNMLQF